MMAKLQQLLDHLRLIPAGEIADGGELASLLVGCWGELDGASAGGMEPEKLLWRMEDISWHPPELSFTIERHGGTVLGSSRAEIQHWNVNVETRSATCSTGGHKQLTPMQARLNVKPLAEEIVGLILERQIDRRLKWNANGRVRVVIGNIIPPGSAAQQTVAERRRRFRDETERLLTKHGWRKVSANVYAPPS